MMSIFGKGALKMAQQATRTAAIDTIRITAGAGLVLGGYYVMDQINSSGFFANFPSKSNAPENAPEHSFTRKA